MAKLKTDFTRGNITSLLIRFCMPFLLANLLQALYGIVDMLVVGIFCKTHVMVGVNTGGHITHLVTMAVSGLTVGATILVAQYYSARREQDASETIGTLFSLLFICAIVLTVLVIALQDVILDLMNLEGEAFQAGREYLTICMYGTVFIFGYNAISAIQRGMGDAKRPLFFVGVACVVNVALDLWFVGGIGMGAAGAAWATIIAQAVSLLLAAFYLSRSNFVFDFRPESFRIVPQKTKLLITLGVPSSLQSVITNISFLLMTALANGISNPAGAAVGIVGKFNGVAILPVIAMSSSVSSIAAQNIVAGKFDRAQKAMTLSIGLSIGIGAIVFALSQIIPGPILSLFKSDDAEVIRLGSDYLRAFSIDYLCVPFIFCMNGLIMAAGYTGYTLFTSCMSSVVLRMPLAYWLSGTALGIRGIGYAAPAASFLSIFFCAWFIITGRWKRNKTGIRRETDAV